MLIYELKKPTKQNARENWLIKKKFWENYEDIARTKVGNYQAIHGTVIREKWLRNIRGKSLPNKRTVYLKFMMLNAIVTFAFLKSKKLNSLKLQQRSKFYFGEG